MKITSRYQIFKLTKSPFFAIKNIVIPPRDIFEEFVKLLGMKKKIR